MTAQDDTMKAQLEGSVVLVTGGAAGFGKAAALAFGGRAIYVKPT